MSCFFGAHMRRTRRYPLNPGVTPAKCPARYLRTFCGASPWRSTPGGEILWHILEDWCRGSRNQGHQDLCSVGEASADSL
jgi:hypothetical protein